MDGSRQKKAGSRPRAGDAAKKRPRKREEKKPRKRTSSKNHQRKNETPAPAPVFDFAKLKHARHGARLVPVPISLRDAQDAADRAMEIASLLRSEEANLAIVIEKQKRVVTQARSRIDAVRTRFDEEASKWEQRKAPKTRPGIWAFDLNDKDENHAHGKKYFACAALNTIFGPDPITKDDLESIKQEEIVHPKEIERVTKMIIDEAIKPADVVISAESLGLDSGIIETPSIGACEKDGTKLYPNDGHYTYKNLLFCKGCSQCAKCGRVVLLDKDDFVREVEGKKQRVCTECAEAIDDRSSRRASPPKSNRKKLRDAAAGTKENTGIAWTSNDQQSPAPKDALVPHAFCGGAEDPSQCAEPKCGRDINDGIHDVGDEQEGRP